MAQQVFKNPAAQAEAMAKTPKGRQIDIDEWEYDGIDDDYERSYGPVNTPEKYKQYQQWLANGESFDNMAKTPRVKTLEDARKNTRWLLANDMNNSILEAYDEYLASKGKPRQIQDLPNGEHLYPKGSWKNVVNDDEYLKNNVLPYMTSEYGYDDDYDLADVTDDQIESSLAYYLKNYR